jgi:hypothetical protein
MSGLRQRGRQVTGKLSSRNDIWVESLIKKQDVHFFAGNLVVDGWICAAAVRLEQHIPLF